MQGVGVPWPRRARSGVRWARAGLVCSSSSHGTPVSMRDRARRAVPATTLAHLCYIGAFSPKFPQGVDVNSAV
jgi:hypothetical protein